MYLASASNSSMSLSLSVSFTAPACGFRVPGSVTSSPVSSALHSVVVGLEGSVRATGLVRCWGRCWRRGEGLGKAGLFVLAGAERAAEPGRRGGVESGSSPDSAASVARRATLPRPTRPAESRPLSTGHRTFRP